jgi:hypothetical protein
VALMLERGLWKLGCGMWDVGFIDGGFEGKGCEGYLSEFHNL